MSTRQNPDALDRLSTLLADEALCGLEPHDLEALDALLPAHASRERDRVMQTASLIQLAYLRQDQRGLSRMPDRLRSRLIATGRSQLETARAASRQAGSPVADLADARRRRGAAANDAGEAAAIKASPGTLSWHRHPAAGWLVAATLALAFVVFRADPPGVEVPQTLASILDAEDVVRIPWQPPTEPGFEAVSGEVVWSSSLQQGVLRLAGMPVNDPATSQYQLWIVDPSRDRDHPVDGGVFDVSRAGEVLVPIDAKLPITRPVVFAITREQPGGVVVSAGPLLVVAPVGQSG